MRKIVLTAVTVFTILNLAITIPFVAHKRKLGFKDDEYQMEQEFVVPLKFIPDNEEVMAEVAGLIEEAVRIYEGEVVVTDPKNPFFKISEIAQLGKQSGNTYSYILDIHFVWQDKETGLVVVEEEQYVFKGGKEITGSSGGVILWHISKTDFGWSVTDIVNP